MLFEYLFLLYFQYLIYAPLSSLRGLGVMAIKIMTKQNQKIKAEIERKVKNTGKRNIRVGIILLIIAAIAGMVIFQISPESWQIIPKLFLPGAVFLGIGLRQFQLKNKKDLREAGVQTYGVEEPENYWTCPKCKNENQNISFDCKSCGYSLK